MAELTMENAVVELCSAFGAVIKGAGDAGIPSGHLYAMVCGKMSLDSYNKIIGILKQQRIVSESNYLLKYIG